MLINGFQKLTLLDYPGKTACTLFTGGCNLRCPFCHNATLVLHPKEYPAVTEEEIFSYLKKRKNTLDGVCITGGEPMLNKDLPELAEKIKGLGFLLKIDTNGFFPDELKYIVNSGLCDYVAVDIKNSLPKYPMTCGRENLDLAPFLESLSFLKRDPVDHEFRTTVSRTYHTAEDLLSIASLLGSGQKYFLQSFRDSGNLLCDGIEGYSPSELNDLLYAVRSMIPDAGLRGV